MVLFFSHCIFLGLLSPSLSCFFIYIYIYWGGGVSSQEDGGTRTAHFGAGQLHEQMELRAGLLGLHAKLSDRFSNHQRRHSLSPRGSLGNIREARQRTR